MAHPRRIALATKNEHKLVEITRICSDWPVEWVTVRDRDPGTFPDVDGRNMLSGAMAMLGQKEVADANEADARKLTPDDPYFHWMVGLRLQDLEMKELAEKHFQRAVQLDSTFILRRKSR